MPLCLGVHRDVHIGVVDEAGLDGLPEQGLFMCFKQSEIEVIDVNMFILVVDRRVFLQGVSFSSAFNCVLLFSMSFVINLDV